MKTSKNNLAVVFISASICGKDGLISSLELEMMYSLTHHHFMMSKSEFESAIDYFFDSHDQVDFHIAQVTSKKDQNKILDIVEKSASADGLDIRENIGFQRLKAIWGVK